MATLFNAGDALRGARIAVNARRLSKVVLIHQSGRHKAQQIIASDNAYAVIGVPLKARPQGP